MNPDLIREILSTKFGHFEKPKINPLGKLLVTGLANYEGEKWARHRRIINPAFHIEKLRRMQPAFSSCCCELINRIGSSHEEGWRIFQLQIEQAQLHILSFENVYIPGFRFFPTPVNRRRNQINREVRSLLRGMIEKREKVIKSGVKNSDDLLGLLIETNLKEFEEHGKYKKGGMTTEDIIEECKLFYFAGHETTSVLLNWTIVLLSIDPSWQERAREEVRQVFGENAPDFDGLSRLKIVSMILHEVLRPYPPVTLLNRMTYKIIELGGITYQKDGIWKATKNNQMAFFPFGWGSRICIGQNFAISEAKMCLCMILQHFTFELSASYIHAPYTVITLQPQYGTQVVLRKIQ